MQYERLRYWVEYYGRYTENQERDDEYLPDAEQQLSLVLEEEHDVSILLKQALERSKQQIKLLK